MQYEIMAIQLEKKLDELEKGNRALRSQLAISLNENYFLKNKIELMTCEIEELKKVNEILKHTKDNIINSNYKNLKDELEFYKNTNIYKIWVRYRKIPEPLRKIFRALFLPVKILYKTVRGKAL